MTAILPTAEQIARAVVLASRAVGEDPESIFRNKGTSRARLIALASLREIFPKARYDQLGRMLNFASPKRAVNDLAEAQHGAAWRDDWIDEVVGGLVSQQYGERAL
ncbi:hypothetical protein SAMN05216456_1275 [Devosia crocina]|uniref:Uncharacterized protein n=1 Tax=Devosia crocina TaxID=429728 RepID=A0A1I7N983_9HYPH|nr:hypothetical protein [Devosia crocina]SFV31230.1 hypothetical protein SAMN05216456_1275 [Devosia crocina]